MLVICTAYSSPVSQDDKNIVLAKKLFEAFNKYDWKTMAAFYSDNALFLDPSFGKEFVSKSRVETIAKYAELQSMFPDIQDSVVNLYPSEKTIVVEFISTDTTPDGTKFTLPIVSILTIENEQIVKDATYYDL